MHVTAETVDRTLRRVLLGVYALAVGAGVAAVLFVPPSMGETIGDTGANLWGLMTLLGGSACLAGVTVPRGRRGDWFGEYVGIWALVGVVAVYAGVIAATLDREPGRLAGMFLLCVLVLLLVTRWFRVRDDAKKATTAPERQLPPAHVDRP